MVATIGFLSGQFAVCVFFSFVITQVALRRFHMLGLLIDKHVDLKAHLLSSHPLIPRVSICGVLSKLVKYLRYNTKCPW